MKYQIDESLCTGCGLCVNICPVRAITLSDTAHIDTGSCTGCGACANVCRQKAIIEMPAETMPANVSLPAAVTKAATAIGSYIGNVIRQCRSDISGAAAGSSQAGRGRGRGRGMKRRNKKRW